jgi:hypothetical protein
VRTVRDISSGGYTGKKVAIVSFTEHWGGDLTGSPSFHGWLIYEKPGAKPEVFSTHSRGVPSASAQQ